MLTILQYFAIYTHSIYEAVRPQRIYYNEEMSSVKTLDLLPRYIYTCLTVCAFCEDLM